MLNIAYTDGKTNIWVMERTKVIDTFTNMRQMKWSWAGHNNRLKDDRWTSLVTTLRPCNKKKRQGRPANRWRDDLDKYWSDTIWERSAQDRLTWRRHVEAFAQPRDTTAVIMMVMMEPILYSGASEWTLVMVSRIIQRSTGRVTNYVRSDSEFARS